MKRIGADKKRIYIETSILCDQEDLKHKMQRKQLRATKLDKNPITLPIANEEFYATGIDEVYTAYDVDNDTTITEISLPVKIRLQSTHLDGDINEDEFTKQVIETNTIRGMKSDILFLTRLLTAKQTALHTFQSKCSNNYEN